MTTTRPKMTFEEYLEYDDGTDNFYEWVAGELIEMPPESEPNDSIANFLYLQLVALVGFRLVRPGKCEVEVPVLKPRQARNRFPDVIVLQPEHLALTRSRLTIRLSAPPPLMVAEVVSPGQANRKRDYEDKREQYQVRGIAEYWIIDPQAQTVTVLALVDGQYQEEIYRSDDRVNSPLFPAFRLTAAEILQTEV